MNDKQTSTGLDLSRRQLIKGAAGLAGVGAVAGLFPSLLWAQDTLSLSNSFRSLTNPYHALFNRGGEAYAASLKMPYLPQVTEGNSQKGIADVRALIAKTGGNLILNIEPNDSADARVIIEQCVKAGVYVTTIWNKPDDMHPWDYDPYWVAHISEDGEAVGEAIATELFESMGGKGGVVALGGIYSNVAAIGRRAGLEAALKKFPDIELLDFQPADWSANRAFPIVQSWLTRFGSSVKGIWCANDDMGMGALEALRGEGLAGMIPVVGIDGIPQAVEAVQSGEYVATASLDPFWLGTMGLALGHAAKTGRIDPRQEPREHREFYVTPQLITRDNAEAFYQANFKATPQVDANDFWGRVAGPIRY
ncbi:sugar ABC transporter substrate-binding protein [Pseudomonas daroniae]|uniref:Sugar ABC transporter substrate-binding protein n=1 Tax=Phytopseudomonas daroniae TaxID=2487519 RepID=A0A4Q9QGR6_9GAMM|nr:MULTISPECIES: sugar ABC transporter substrate-binding protein [Pseudomonas]TBU73414.1 sugar ABC transporter substrate-binding protein [Pseudomonas daroniae]TBU74510.1 sugar ABC transporter substrate-binding protein [Pseudomonas daroniae]TBU79166.1 sugar ABC transporter substrate-binding protein [Pseudomonas sp. FRB 228]TBU88064.1 sugar ABC transporter substrate-binding protein [Pseudomonas daroniae]